MKPSILVVMLDFLVCSLLLFVIGTGGSQTQFATSTPPTVHEEFSTAAIQAQQDEWNREYEQQTLLSQLQTETTEKEQLQARLTAREESLQAVAAEKARVEQAKVQTEQTLTNVASQLTRVTVERARLEQEGSAAKERVAQLQTEQGKLQQQATQLGQTVASQQATISTLGEEVRASQVRVESQLNEVTGGQRAMEQNVAALAENVKELQAEMNPEERARLMAAIGDLAKGQQDIQSRLETLGTAGQGDQYGQSLNNIEVGQEALRQQTAKLGEQIESIKARRPGPYKAVKNARLDFQVVLTRRDPNQNTLTHFKAAAYPPVVDIDGRSFIVANYRTLGLAWWGLTGGEITEANFSASFPRGSQSTNDTQRPPPILLNTACALLDDPHVVTIELAETPGMELAGPEAGKLNIFKSTSAGLSFEVDAAPDLSDPRYLVVRRPMRGIVAWFENPAYRPEPGDYLVTADGKLVGIMVNRERCLILNKATLLDCAASIPLADAREFQRAAAQYPRVR